MSESVVAFKSDFVSGSRGDEESEKVIRAFLKSHVWPLSTITRPDPHPRLRIQPLQHPHKTPRHNLALSQGLKF